ncbi:hypothetical protein ABFS82_13G151300 [Erythranthe guttata]
MLSTESPPPPLDLPCNNNCEIPQLKNYSISSDEDERDSSYKNNHNQVEVDLLNKSSFDDNHNNPLPKFSIRDYVFDTRGKDIENNWPFSQENLQLCLKYGVKDVLPPFQSLDSVRNPTTEKLVSDVKLSESDNRSVDEKLASNVQNIDSSRSEEDKEHPSCSDLNSVPVAEESQRTPLKKVVKSNTQNSVKKCRLVLKLNNIAERKPNENSSSNPSAASETTMASKVCPVCKTFSSSSNTTLNAHIDQCLSSGGPTVKWTENPKVSIKHRIKPRKTRMMVDIYETALQCTLEDLDRRNGTNWASSNSGFPAQGLKACAEEKNKAYSSVDVGESNEKGAVYIDSKSPKIRSLSKLNDQPSSSFSKYECGGPSKIVEKDKCCEFVERKKKKCLVRKHELLKHPIYGQRSCSPSTDNLPKSPTYGPKIFLPKPDHSPEPKVNNGQQKQCEGYLTPPHTSFDRMKSDDLGMIKQWVGSKRTGPKKKKNNLQHENNQHPDKTVECSRENGENPLLPTQSHRRKENVLCDSSLISQDCHVKKIQLARKDPPSVAQNQDSSRSNKKMRINVDPAVNTDSIISRPCGFPSQGKEKTSSGHAISSGSKKFSSLRKKLLSVRRTSAPESKKNLGGKRLDFKKPRLSYASGSDDEVAVSQTKRATGKPLINGTTVLKLRKKRSKSTNAAKEDVSLKDSKESSPEPDSDDVERNVSSFLRENVIIDTNNEFVCKPTYKIAAEGEEAFDKSLDSTNFHEFVCSENVVEDLVAPNGRAVAETDANDEGKRNYFADVDPIPIPGPPGSFLPSPGRMCSEDLQGNSSLTTCRVQSSEDEHEAIVDRMMGSSDSPISARSYSGPVVNFSKSHVQHGIEGGPINTERELIHLDESRGNLMCCCSRKDGALMYNQDSQLLRRRTMTPLSVPAREETRSSNYYSGYWKEQTQEPGKTGANCEAKLRACVDCEFPSPSTPNNPVLRLMGKNLMVANKDENQVSPQTRPAYFSGTAMEHPISPRFCADNSHTGAHSFGRNLPRGHYSMYENSQTSMPAQHFDFVRSNPANFRPLSHDQLSSGHHHPSTTHMLSSKSFGGGTFITSSPNTRTYDSRGNNNKYKEIIVIDDSPENRATNKGKQYTEGEGSYVTITSSSLSMASRYEYNPTAVNHRHHHHPFYGYPVYNGGPPPMERNGNVQVAVPKEMMNNNANLGQWNYCSSPPEGYRLLHPNSSLQASASTANLRSSLSYFSPSFL